MIRLNRTDPTFRSLHSLVPISRIPHHFPRSDVSNRPPTLVQSNRTNPLYERCNAFGSTPNGQCSQCPPEHRSADRPREGPRFTERHGLTAAQLVIAAEDREEFDELHAQLQADIRPQGALQQILFDLLVTSAWNLRRIRGMEAELTASAATYLDILDSPELTAKLDRLARHQTRIERSFHRSLRELKSLQTDAALAPTLPRAFMREAPPLASKTQIAKRTQALAIANRQNGAEKEYWSGADAEAAALRSALENYGRPQILTTGC